MLELKLSDKQSRHLKAGDLQRFSETISGNDVTANFDQEVRDELRALLAAKGRYPLKPIVHNAIPEGHVYHRNYLEYLQLAWGTHHGVVFAPHFFWYGLLTEIASHIKKHSDLYREHFTKAPKGEKIDIKIPNADLIVMDLKTLMEALVPLVPMNTSLLIPEFSTSTNSSKIATYAAFADAVSPYYNYMMFACDIPKIRLEGTVEDWQKMKNCLDELQVLSKLKPWLQKVSSLVGEISCQITRPNPDFWQDMFKLRECGSGHQTEVSGWITDTYLEKPRVAYAENFSGQISKVDYKQLDTDRHFSMYQGLFFSKQEEGFLIPDFSFTVEERELGLEHARV